MKKLLLIVVAVAAIGMLLGAFASDAEARHGRGVFGGYGFPYNQYAYGNGYWPYTLGWVPVPPYYALHPPVYYSVPIPRTYGYSPYPYHGNVRTPEIERQQPLSVINPYTKPEAKKASNKVAKVAPKMIYNHFVTPESAIPESLVLAD